MKIIGLVSFSYFWSSLRRCCCRRCCLDSVVVVAVIVVIIVIAVVVTVVVVVIVVIQLSSRCPVDNVDAQLQPQTHEKATPAWLALNPSGEQI